MTDVVKYATKGTLKNLELKIVGNNQPDIAAFDFTSIKKAEHAARIIERKGSKLLVGLVGDSLLEVSIKNLYSSAGKICSQSWCPSGVNMQAVIANLYYFCWDGYWRAVVLTKVFRSSNFHLISSSTR